MWNCDESPAYKLFLQDVSSCVKNGNGWELDIGNGLPFLKITQFQIQVTILRVTGFNNDIMIVSDGTGKAKVTRGSKVPGTTDWIVPGAECCIVATILETGKLPHIDVIKIAPVLSPFLKEMWPLEVSELKNLLLKSICPKLKRQSL